MQTLELANYGVQEMDALEMKTVDGGSFLLGFLIGAIVVAAAIIISGNGGTDPDCDYCH
jgi:hypothetical protein